VKLFFFSAVDQSPKYRYEAELLLASGEKYGRPIHLYDIPAGELWNRYKVNLFLRDDLPKADRYVYLDGDCILNGPGDWEADDCQGVADPLYYCKSKPERCKHTSGFMRNHTVVIGEGQGYDYILQKWHEWGEPIWCNSGVVVLDEEIRLSFAMRWQAWIRQIDRHCEKGFVVGDEAPLMFARHEAGLPLLPPRFNGLCKWQQIYDWHHVIHADGNVSGDDRMPYVRAIWRIGKKDFGA
jgi:hypothetical protein